MAENVKLREKREEKLRVGGGRRKGEID